MEAWEQSPGEPAQAYQAFILYRDLGAERTLGAAYARHCATNKHDGNPPDKSQPTGTVRAPGNWRRWSAAHSWQQRAEAWDRRTQAVVDRATVAAVAQAAGDQALADVATDWAARAEQQRRELWELREQLIEKTRAMLAFGLAKRTRKVNGHSGEVTEIYEPVRWSLSDVPRFIDAAQRLGELSAGPAIPAGDGQGAKGAADPFFETEALLADAVPDGVLPTMPANPNAKPALGASIMEKAASLHQPAKRPRPDAGKGPR